MLPKRTATRASEPSRSHAQGVGSAATRRRGVTPSVWNQIADYGVGFATTAQRLTLKQDCVTRLGGLLRPCSRANWGAYNTLVANYRNARAAWVAGGSVGPHPNIAYAGDMCCWTQV